MLKFEDLTGVNLIGHSYGGMVATGVADRARARIAKLIYIDAFAPEDGDSVIDLLPEAVRAPCTNLGRRMRIPPTQMPPDTPAGGPRLVRAAAAAATGEDFRTEIEIPGRAR